MVKRSDVEKSTKRFAKKSLMAFLEGEKNLNWIAGVVKSSGVKGEKLKEIFDGLKGYGDMARYQQAYQECRERGLFEEESKWFRNYKEAMSGKKQNMSR